MLRRQEKIECLFLAVSWTLEWDRVLASAGPGHQAPFRKKAGLRCLSPEQRGSLVMLQTKERHPALYLEEVNESDLNCRSIYPFLPHAKSAFQTQIWFCLLPDSWQDRSWLPSWNFLCLVIWTSFSLALRTGTDQILWWIFLFLTSSFLGVLVQSSRGSFSTHIANQTYAIVYLWSASWLLSLTLRSLSWPLDSHLWLSTRYFSFNI